MIIERYNFSAVRFLYVVVFIKLVKSQITNYKLQINLKSQNSNPKRISEY
jgi:hypothetical protein